MRRAVYLAAALLVFGAPAAWAGGGFDSVFADYTKDGHIDPCKHSAADLRRARADIPPDIEQYAPDFPEALDAALEARWARRAGGRARRGPSSPTGCASGSAVHRARLFPSDPREMMRSPSQRGRPEQKTPANYQVSPVAAAPGRQLDWRRGMEPTPQTTLDPTAPSEALRIRRLFTESGVHPFDTVECEL